MRIRNILPLLFVASLVILAACGGGDDQTNGNDSEETADDNLNKTGFPIVDEKIELNFFAAKSEVATDWNDILLLNEYEKMTNVKVKWEQVPDEGRDEKRNLALSSGDLPDVFYGAWIPTIDLIKYGEQGVFIPLNDLIDEYAPNLKAILDEYQKRAYYGL